MNYVIHQHFHKIFVKSIFCLARIGSELVIETNKDCLYFRVLSSSQSAYAQFQYNRPFFSTFSTNTNNKIKCKLDIKSMLTGFKNLSNVIKLMLTLCHNDNDIYV